MRELKTFFFFFLLGIRLSVHNNSKAKEECIKALIVSSTSSSLKLVLYLEVIELENCLFYWLQCHQENDSFAGSKKIFFVCS